MIDVLHLIDTARIGGPGKTIINSARYIDHDRFRVHVASFTRLDDSRNEFADAVTHAGIPFLPLPETRRLNPSHLRAIRAYVRDHDIRVVHAHGYRSDVVSWLATRGTGAALVTTHHGWIRNHWRQALFTRIATRLSAQFDGVQVVSGHLLEELPDRLRRSGRVEVVHNAVVLDDYAPIGARAAHRHTLGVEDGHVLIGVVGRLSLEKGCLEMIDAFARVRARHPHARLVLVGEGPLEAEVRRRIDEQTLGGSVRIVPHQRDVRPVYEALDILVCPSRTEGLSNVIMEAMVYGLPVVATRVGGNGELVRDGSTGVLVPASQPEVMADGIGGLVDDAARRQALGAGGRARVQEAFSFDGRMRREERFYERVLGTRAQPL